MRKLTFTDIVISREHYKCAVERRKKTIDEMKEMKAPQVILDDYDRKLKRDRMNYNAFDLALKMYMLGYRDGEKGNQNNLNLLPKDMLTPEQRLLAAIFSSNNEEAEFVKTKLQCIHCEKEDCDGCALYEDEPEEAEDGEQE